MIFSRKAKQAEYIVDVHCHILPGIDDGSRSMEETLKMLPLNNPVHVLLDTAYKLRDLAIAHTQSLNVGMMRS